MTRPAADIIAAGKKTRFKKGNKQENKPWSVRYWLRLFAEAEIDMTNAFTDPDAFRAEIRKLLKMKRTGKSKVAQVIALRMIEKTITKMDAKLVTALIENIEGKMVQPIMEIQPQESPEEFGTLEEAESAYARLSQL